MVTFVQMDIGFHFYNSLSGMSVLSVFQNEKVDKMMQKAGAIYQRVWQPWEAGLVTETFFTSQPFQPFPDPLLPYPCVHHHLIKN